MQNTLSDWDPLARIAPLHHFLKHPNLAVGDLEQMVAWESCFRVSLLLGRAKWSRVDSLVVENVKWGTFCVQTDQEPKLEKIGNSTDGFRLLQENNFLFWGSERRNVPHIELKRTKTWKLSGLRALKKSTDGDRQHQTDFLFSLAEFRIHRLVEKVSSQTGESF